MEKLHTIGFKALAAGLFFVCWLFGIQWTEHEYERGMWGFWIVVSGAAGLFALHLANRTLRTREQAAHLQRQLEVLRLAEAEAGQLTATRTAIKLGWTLRATLETLRSLQDGVRVTTLVTDEGVRLYEFPEIIHASPGKRAR